MHDDVRPMSTAGNNEMVYGHWVVGCRKTKGQPNACFCIRPMHVSMDAPAVSQRCAGRRCRSSGFSFTHAGTSPSGGSARGAKNVF